MKRSALLFAVAYGAACSVIAYAAVRVAERALFPEPNPAIIIWADKSPFVWRSAIALYLGGAAAFGGFAASSSASARASRGLYALVVIAAGLLLAQGALAP